MTPLTLTIKGMSQKLVTFSTSPQVKNVQKLKFLDSPDERHFCENDSTSGMLNNTPALYRMPRFRSKINNSDAASIA